MRFTVNVMQKGNYAMPEVNDSGSLLAPATTKAPSSYAVGQMMNERDAFELQVRKAKVYAQSTLVPPQYQNNAANCMIALNMAARIKADPLMVMQNMHLVHNRPGWSAQFLIATFNQCGRFTAMRFSETGGPNDKKNWACTAYATELATGERIDGPPVTWEMVEAEGWSKRQGSKWLTMASIMFRYRAGAFLVRTHAPEIAMGLPTVEELRDVIDVEPEHASNGSKSDAVAATLRSKSQALRMEVQHARDDDPSHEYVAGTGDDDNGPTVEQVATAISRADTPDLLDIAEDLISGVRDTKQAVQLRALATDRRLQLGGE
jgi:hypothetical protein